MKDDICLDTILESPDSAIAIRFYDVDITEVTYGEFTMEVRKAMKLIKELMVPGDLLLLCYPRCVEILVMMMACLCSKIPFLFIDPTTPQRRFQRIFEQTGASYMFSTKKMHIDKTQRVCKWNTEYYVYRNENGSSIRWNGAAYLLYTSGTTNEPKCVVISIQNFLRFKKNLGTHLYFYSYKSVLSSTNMSFDISLLEMIIPLLHGQMVHLLSNGYTLNPKKMIRVIEENPIEVVQFTPSHLRFLGMYSKHNFSFLKQVKVLLVGGEQFPIELYNDITNGTQAIIYNMYGPTEATIWSSYKRITCCGDNSIGNPMERCTFSVHDENGNIVKDGEYGELYISGDQIAMGYTDDLMTNKYFICKGGIRLYKTGDIAFKNPLGEYKIIGRLDNQVKHNGHRIELDEIVEQVLQFSGILYCYVKKEENDLCCYYYSESFIPPKLIINHLKRVLPNYMIPTRYYKLAQVCLSQNGKLLIRSIDELKQGGD